MVFEKVRDILVAQLKIKDKNLVTMDSDIAADFDADSIDVIEMLMELEEAYGISVPSEKALELKKVGDIVKFIESLSK